MSIEINSKEFDFFIATVRKMEEEICSLPEEELERGAHAVRFLFEKGSDLRLAVQRQLRKEKKNLFDRHKPEEAREVRALVGRIRQITRMQNILLNCAKLLSQRSGLAAAVFQS